MKKFIKKQINNYIEKYKIIRARQVEIKKYKEKRRKVIYKGIKLSKNQKHEIDKLYKENYGRRISYIYHRHFTAFTGEFDPCYFPEELYIPEFEHFMNPNIEYNRVFEDKNILPMIAKNAGVRMPITLFYCQSGIYYDRDGEICNNPEKYLFNIGEIFAKPSVNSSSGNGCRVIKIVKERDIITGQQINEILLELGDNFICQERLKCSTVIRNIYPDSVNTFRIMTYRWKNEFKVAPIIMRIGQGGANVDNAHAGGMFIAIEDDGQLHSKAFTEFKQEYTEHPDTHTKFSDCRITGLEKVKEAAISLHTKMPQIGVINWDFTIDEEEEPVLIEANIMGGSIWLFEMAHGKGVFGENTKNILQWLKKIKKVKMDERSKYYFGNL